MCGIKVSGNISSANVRVVSVLNVEEEQGYLAVFIHIAVLAEIGGNLIENIVVKLRGHAFCLGSCYIRSLLGIHFAVRSGSQQVATYRIPASAIRLGPEVPIEIILFVVVPAGAVTGGERKQHPGRHKKQQHGF